MKSKAKIAGTLAVTLGSMLIVGAMLFLAVAHFVDLGKDGDFLWARPLAWLQLKVGIFMTIIGSVLVQRSR